MEPLTGIEIFTRIIAQFTPVWIGLAIIFAVSFYFKRSLGLYGQVLENKLGLIGLFLVFFWVLTAILGEWIITYDPLRQMSGMKNALPGLPPTVGEGAHFLLGGDNLARDVFSRMVVGSRTVLTHHCAAGRSDRADGSGRGDGSRNAPGADGSPRLVFRALPEPTAGARDLRWPTHLAHGSQQCDAAGGGPNRTWNLQLRRWISSVIRASTPSLQAGPLPLASSRKDPLGRSKRRIAGRSSSRCCSTPAPVPAR